MSSQKSTTRKTVAREYLRVSKDAKGRGKSTDQQHDDNIRAISDQGWSAHPQSYRDDDRSASRYARRGREGFAQLVDDLDEGRFDVGVIMPEDVTLLTDQIARRPMQGE
ncbi:recombinase family protein [Leucobacter sp. cx-169]|nr:recombinase family protein [Leucobacter sp. cx-169]